MASSEAVDGSLLVTVEEAADRLSVGCTLRYSLVSSAGSCSEQRFAAGWSR
jgi:hypothetical protein